jgi:hypothetical protein
VGLEEVAMERHSSGHLQSVVASDVHLPQSAVAQSSSSSMSSRKTNIEEDSETLSDEKFDFEIRTPEM